MKGIWGPQRGFEFNVVGGILKNISIIQRKTWKKCSVDNKDHVQVADSLHTYSQKESQQQLVHVHLLKAAAMLRDSQSCWRAVNPSATPTQLWKEMFFFSFS